MCLREGVCFAVGSDLHDSVKGEMAMNISGWKHAWLVLAMTTVCIAFTLGLRAQVETKTATTEGKAAVATNVERGLVLAVSGNDLVVRMSDGTIRNFEDVPESARATVDGKQLGIHDLKPGMKLQRTITTTTTPMTITTIQSVRGKVWAINPPLSMILTLEDGQNQQFKIPKDQKFNVDGKMVDAWGVRKGMTVTATKIVEEPTSVVRQGKTVTGQAAPKVELQETPPADLPLLIAEGGEVPAPAAGATGPAGAPEGATAPAAPGLPAEPAAAPEAASRSSMIWLIVFLGLVVLGVIGWMVVRKNRLRS